MGYYQGDHYRSRRAGDYYRGDPGFFSFIGKIASFLPGVGGIAGKALTFLDKLKRREPGHGLVQEMLAPAPSTDLMLAPPQGVGIMAPGGGGGIITQSPMGTPVHPAAIAMQLERMRHTHPNKSTSTA